MPRWFPLALLTLANLACRSAALQAVGNLAQGPSPACEVDDLAMAKLTFRTCQINWAVKNFSGEMWKNTSQVGCWKLRAYNTDKFFSSALYQSEADGRCALAFSGYHGRLAGYFRAVMSLAFPLEHWNMCGSQVYAPYARLFRHHTSLGNWSKMMNFIGGDTSTCKGELLFGAESMGGSTGEILAACANSGQLHKLMDKDLPSFHLENLYTFGSPASAAQPITNTLSKDGCFKGKRIYFSGDSISRVGSLASLKHARMESVEIWPPKGAKNGTRSIPSVKSFGCLSKETVWDRPNEEPPAPNVTLPFHVKQDPLQHAITNYMEDMEWFHRAGLEGIFGHEVTLGRRRGGADVSADVSPQSLEEEEEEPSDYASSKYLGLMRGK